MGADTPDIVAGRNCLRAYGLACVCILPINSVVPAGAGYTGAVYLSKPIPSGWCANINIKTVGVLGSAPVKARVITGGFSTCRVC